MFFVKWMLLLDSTGMPLTPGDERDKKWEEEEGNTDDEDDHSLDDDARGTDDEGGNQATNLPEKLMTKGLTGHSIDPDVLLFTSSGSCCCSLNHSLGLCPPYSCSPFFLTHDLQDDQKSLPGVVLTLTNHWCSRISCSSSWYRMSNIQRRQQQPRLFQEKRRYRICSREERREGLLFLLPSTLV